MILVRKKDRLLVVYQAIKEDRRLLSELDNKYQTLGLLVALCYNQPVALQLTDLETDLVPVKAKDKEQDVDAVVLLASQVVDVLQAMAVHKHWILVNAVLFSEISSYFQSGNIYIYMCVLTHRQ